jgi:uncharacterized protein with FMN-binding domain
MEFSKAFDKVSHSLLQHKLDHYGIRWSDEIVKYAIVSSAKSLTFDVIPSGMSLI